MAANESYDRPAGEHQGYSDTLSDSELAYGVPGRIQPGKSLADVRDELWWLSAWSDDDARRVPVFAGDRLETGEIYADLRHPEEGTFTPTSGYPVSDRELFIAKNEVPEDLWDQIVQQFTA